LNFSTENETFGLHAMKRTYILSVLVLIAAAYVFKMKFMGSPSGLEAAKDRIRNASQQPVAKTTPSRTPAMPPPAGRNSGPQLGPAETAQPQTAEVSMPPGENERVAHLTKGTFTQVDGTIVYSADAQIDIGHGMLVSSPSGVMVSDEALQHISGDLVLEEGDTLTTMENAFLTLDNAHVEMTSDSSTKAKKEGTP
jgi:hypothetical protein